MTSLFDRIVGVGQEQTDSRFTPNTPRQVYAKGTDHTSLGLGEPGAVNASGMPFPDQNTESTWQQPRQTPLIRIGIYDSVLSYEDGPIGDPNGLLIPQTAPGQWAQLYRAGRLYGR